MQRFSCYPSFAMIGAYLAASLALPLSARAATSFLSHPARGVAAALVALSPSSSQPNFGPNVYIFNPSMPQSVIQATVDAVASQQISNQFGTQRYALLFEPGTYGSGVNPLNFQVGYTPPWRASASPRMTSSSTGPSMCETSASAATTAPRS